MKLEGKVAIVTGAGRGIGRAISAAYAREGARLALVARTATQVEEAAQEARELGSEAVAIPTDVAEPRDVERMVEKTLATFGSLDVLVNNAAILGPLGAFAGNDTRHWADAIRINVIGLALCTHAVLPAMAQGGGGSIINLSGAGVTRASETLSAYGTSKAAVIRFTETLALELEGRNVRVNALGPGQIDTELLDPVIAAEDGVVAPAFAANVRRTKSGRGASLEEAAALAVWLASADSEGLSGRMISATQDDWRNMAGRIPEIMASDLHTMRFVS